MRKLVLFMHCSLDGFVTDHNGDMSWILIDEIMFDVASERTKVSDTALYGRVTWQMMENYWPDAGNLPNATKHDIEHSAWYNQVTKVVASRTIKESSLPPNTLLIRDNLAQEIGRLKQKDGGDIVMFGSPSLAHALMAENLIDDYWIFINPILLGSGGPLFKGINEIIKLTLAESKVFPSGVVCLHYTK
jgi:dihydrofolate reductase